ncbi:Phosphoenolpyruvate/pyruvate domain-containing protein, partial [Coemansia reversa NRRL 1564]
GIVLGIASLATARIVSRLGFDWACVDMEHSPQSATIMAEMVAAIGSSGMCAPLVRVPSHTNEWIRWAVDAGAHGIIIPGVQSREQMWRLVSACRNAASQSSSASFAPVSNAGRGTAHRSHAHLHEGTPPVGTMLLAPSSAGSDVLVIPQIDSHKAADNIEEILSVPGVDAAFVHPQGLCAHGGRVSPSAAGQAQVIPAETLDRILRSSHRLAVPLGIDSADGGAARVGARQGFRMVAVGNDVDVIARAAAEQLRL